MQAASCSGTNADRVRQGSRHSLPATPYDGYNHVYGALERLLESSYLGLHHRLDSPTSGVMLFTLNKKANQE